MNNIFEIQEDLYSIFNQIEENEGELTPELEEALCIKQEEFSNKIKSYTDVIKTTENTIDLIDKEIARLKALKDSKNKLIDRLNKIIIQAVNTFGNSDKKGTKFVDWGTGKVSIRHTKSVKVDEDKLNQCIKELDSYLNFRVKFNIDDISLDSFYNDVNTVSTGNNDTEFVSNFTKEDLESLTIDLNSNISLKSCLEHPVGIKLLKSLVEYGVYSIKPKVSKTDLKSILSKEDNNISFANIVDNESVNIK